MPLITAADVPVSQGSSAIALVPATVGVAEPLFPEPAARFTTTFTGVG